MPNPFDAGLPDGRPQADGNSGDGADYDGPVSDASVDGAPAGMIFIPAGSFMMGCSNASTLCPGATDETPYHAVMLSDYYIDATEVTQSAYKGCVDAGTCTPPTTNFNPSVFGAYPVTNVSWQQALVYCAWVGRRLPTEAEWEKAGRGSDGRTYPWGEAMPTCTLANLGGGCGGATQVVGTHPAGASPYGVLDMVGNVHEWVNDWHANDYYSMSPSADPQGPATGTSRVVRGNDFSTGVLGTPSRVSDRAYWAPPDSASPHGFRCAK